MNSKLRLMITGVVLFFLLPAVALGDGVVKTLYIDGVLVGEANDANEGLTWPIDRVIIGTEGLDYMYNEYVGKLDDFAIYAGVLSAAQVTAHWDARINYTAYQAAVSADNPLLWLKLDEPNTASGAVAYNSGSVDVNGTYITQGPGTIIISTTAGFVTGSSGVDLNVNGRLPELGEANGVRIDVPDTNGYFSTELNGDVTIELWANYTDLNDYPRFFQHNGSYTNLDGYALVAQLNDGNSMAVIGGGSANFMDFDNDINDGQWHHIVVTYDSNYIVIPPPPTLPYPNEVMLDNPLLYLRFEDEMPKDYSGHDHWVGYGGGTSIVDKVGGYGKCLFMTNSTSSYAAATNGPNAPPNEGDPNYYLVVGDQYAFAPDDITFEVWYRVPGGLSPGPDDYAYFFQQVGPWDWPPGSGQGSHRAPGASNSGGTVRIMGGTETWYTGRSSLFDVKASWHQLVVTYDEQYQGDPNKLFTQLYMDGKFLDDWEFANGPAAKLGPELSHVMFGARNDIGYTYNAYAGYIDEVAIYEGILDPNRIAIHYEAFMPKTCAEKIERGGLPTWTIGDRNQNCIIEFYDFAIFAEDWALCNDPAGGAGCSPNW